MRRRRGTSALAAAACLLVATSAGAAPADVDLRISLNATNSFDPFTSRVLPSGETVPVTSRNFAVYLFIDPRPARAKLHIELGGGLRWRTDGSDPGDPDEGCTSAPASAECDASVLVGGDVGWWWDVVAPQNGRFTYEAAIVETSEPDPNLSNNSTSLTIVVDEQAGGGSTAVSAARLTPAKPKAGSAVVATVRVTVDGAAVLPTRVACTGSIGTAKLKGTPSAAPGRAICTYRPPKAAKGKSLKGSVSFTTRGQRFTKRFSAKLG